MDKLKQYTATLRKHYFWVLCGLILIVALATWYPATGDLQAKYQDNHRKINSTLMQLNDFHERSPNADFKTGLAGETAKLNSQVLDAWKEFSKQQHGKLLWPPKVEVVNQLAPNAEIPEAIRENFVTNVIKPNLERIFEVVNIRRPIGNPADQELGPLGGQRAVIDFEGIVNWDAGKRQELRDRFRMNEIPSTIWVRAKMEDMWIYESLVNIIAKINEGSTDSLNASIKRIEKLDLAQWAIQDAQKHPGAELKLKKPDAALGAGAGAGGDDGIVKIPGGSESKLAPDLALLEGRYIDEHNQPVPAEAAIAGFVDPQSTEGKAEVQRLPSGRTVKEPPFAEFRQVFVDMQFMMDQRKVPDLMAACANSPLPIEIRQVVEHFYDIDTVKTADAGAGPLQIGAEIPMPGHNERAPYDALVQIRGIVYIYNQPEEAKLGTGSAPKPAQRRLGTPLPKKVEEVPLVPADQFNP